nr:hypothetical protein [Hyalangium versicolor]
MEMKHRPTVLPTGCTRGNSIGTPFFRHLIAIVAGLYLRPLEVGHTIATYIPLECRETIILIREIPVVALFSQGLIDKTITMHGPSAIRITRDRADGGTIVTLLLGISDTIAAGFIRTAVAAAPISVLDVPVVAYLAQSGILELVVDDKVSASLVGPAISATPVPVYVIVVVTNLFQCLVENAISAKLRGLAIGAARISRLPIAIITDLTHGLIDPSVATGLIRLAVAATTIPVLDIAVVACLLLLNYPVTA